MICDVAALRRAQVSEGGTDEGLVAVAAFLPVEIAEDLGDGLGGYTPLVLPPIPIPPKAIGSVVPFRRPASQDAAPGPEGATHEPPGPSGPEDDAAAQIEAVLPDGVVLRLPGDVAPDRLAELVGALRTPQRCGPRPSAATTTRATTSYASTLPLSSTPTTTLVG